MGWLSSIFKKKVKVVSKIKKVAIIVGHSHTDCGAIGWNKQEEFAYNSLVAQGVFVANTGKETRVFYRGNSGIVGVGKEVSSWNPDVSIELHLNAFNGKASGCEVLCLNGENLSAEIGRSFANSFAKIFDRKLRAENGIKFLGNRDRGAANLASCNVPLRVLIEPFFLDNQEEWIDPLTYKNFLVEWIRGL